MFSLLDRFLGKFLVYASYFSKTFFVLQPLHLNKIQNRNIFNITYNDISVIIQGPIYSNKNFEFLCITVNNYQNIGINNIIISLSNILYYHKIKDKFLDHDSVIVILVDNDSTISGISNINYQKKSVIAALNFVKTKYVLKQRIDQRFANENFLNYFISLLNIFPSNSNLFNSRVILLSSTSLLFVNHHLCDFLQFGFTNDICDIWGKVEYSNFDCSNTEYFGNTFIKNDEKCFTNYYRPEIYLGMAIKEKYDGDFSNQYNNYLDIIRDVLIIVDQNTVGLIWDKYSALQILPFPRLYNSYERISFDIWIGIYRGQYYEIPKVVKL